MVKKERKSSICKLPEGVKMNNQTKKEKAPENYNSKNRTIRRNKLTKNPKVAQKLRTIQTTNKYTEKQN